MKLLLKILSLALIVMPVSALAVYDVGLDVTTSAGASASSTGTGATVDVDVTTTNATADTSADADAQLQAFSELMTSANANVQAVEVDSTGSVDVSYKHQGYLFGFIPVVVTSHTTVAADADGAPKAHVRMPWWSFLVSGVSQVRTDAETSLNADADVQTYGKSQTAIDSRIKLAEAIVLKMNAAVKASYDVKANVK